MTDPMELVGRLENGSDRFLKWAYKEPYSGAPVISIPRHPDNIDSLLTEAAACIREIMEAQTELAAAARAYFVGWMMDEADDSGPEYTGCSIEQHLAAKRLGEALPPAPGAE